jgi:hypothetical protein
MSQNGAGKRERLAVLVASGHSVTKAAARIGIGRRTASRWLVEPELQTRISELRAAMVRRALGAMSAGMASAAVRLRRLVQSSDERVALGACRAVLELRTKLHESEELEQRLTALEQSEQRKGKAGQ